LLIDCNLKKNDESNIRITNDAFENLLCDFLNNHTELNDNKNRIVSVSVSIEHGDTTIGIYADKKLKAEYYIGVIKNNKNEIYFYSDNNQSINGLYDIVCAPLVKVDSLWDYTETYTLFYDYKNGSFVLPEFPNFYSVSP
jgi:hypothetical protein